MTFEKVVVQNIQHGLSSVLCDAVQSISRWQFIKAALPHVLHCSSTLLREKLRESRAVSYKSSSLVARQGVNSHLLAPPGDSGQGVTTTTTSRPTLAFSQAETKLLYTLHWILLDAASECEDATSIDDYGRQITTSTPARGTSGQSNRKPSHFLHDLSSIQLFIHLFAPLINELKAADFDTLKLESGLSLWLPLMVYRQPITGSLPKPVKLLSTDWPASFDLDLPSPPKSSGAGVDHKSRNLIDSKEQPAIIKSAIPGGIYLGGREHGNPIVSGDRAAPSRSAVEEAVNTDIVNRFFPTKDEGCEKKKIEEQGTKVKMTDDKSLKQSSFKTTKVTHQPKIPPKALPETSSSADEDGDREESRPCSLRSSRPKHGDGDKSGDEEASRIGQSTSTNHQQLLSDVAPGPARLQRLVQIWTNESEDASKRLAQSLPDGILSSQSPATSQLASHLDVALVRSLFCSEMTERGVEWALAYLFQRLLQLRSLSLASSDRAKRVARRRRLAQWRRNRLGGHLSCSLEAADALRSFSLPDLTWTSSSADQQTSTCQVTGGTRRSVSRPVASPCDQQLDGEESPQDSFRDRLSSLRPRSDTLIKGMQLFAPQLAGVKPPSSRQDPEEPIWPPRSEVKGQVDSTLSSLTLPLVNIGGSSTSTSRQSIGWKSSKRSRIADIKGRFSRSGGTSKHRPSEGMTKPGASFLLQLSSTQDNTSGATDAESTMDGSPQDSTCFSSTPARSLHPGGGRVTSSTERQSSSSVDAADAPESSSTAFGITRPSRHHHRESSSSGIGILDVSDRSASPSTGITNELMSMTRSISDPALKSRTVAEKAEYVNGAVHYVTTNGHLDYSVVLRGLYWVSTVQRSPRVAQLLVECLTLLFDLGDWSVTNGPKSRRRSRKTGRIPRRLPSSSSLINKDHFDAKQSPGSSTGQFNIYKPVGMHRWRRKILQAAASHHSIDSNKSTTSTGHQVPAEDGESSDEAAGKVEVKARQSPKQSSTSDTTPSAKGIGRWRKVVRVASMLPNLRTPPPPLLPKQIGEPSKKPSSLSRQLLNTNHALAVEILFRSISCLGCPCSQRSSGTGGSTTHHCTLARSDVTDLSTSDPTSSSNLIHPKILIHDGLLHLHEANPKLFTRILTRFVVALSVADVVDILHCVTELCYHHHGQHSSVGGSIGEGVAGSTRSIISTQHSRGAYRHTGQHGPAEGLIVACLIGPFVRRLVRCRRELVGQENIGLFANIRLLLAYLRRNHASLFRRNLLVALLCPVKRTIERLIPPMLGGSRSSLLAPPGRLSVVAWSRRSTRNSLWNVAKPPSMNVAVGQHEKGRHRRRSSHTSQFLLTTQQDLESDPGGQRSQRLTSWHASAGTAPRASIVARSIRKASASDGRGLLDIGLNQSDSRHDSDPTTSTLPSITIIEHRWVNTSALKESLFDFAFLMESCDPGTIPEPQLVASLFDLDAPVIARACLLLECAFFVRRCNRGDWAGWTKLNIPPYLFQPTSTSGVGVGVLQATTNTPSISSTVSTAPTSSGKSGGRGALDANVVDSTNIKLKAGYLFHTWAKALGRRLGEFVAKLHTEQQANCVHSPDKPSIEGGQHLLEENFLDDASVNPDGDSCPYALLSMGVQLLLECTSYLREMHARQVLQSTTTLQPAADSQHHHQARSRSRPDSRASLTGQQVSPSSSSSLANMRSKARPSGESAATGNGSSFKATRRRFSILMPMFVQPQQTTSPSGEDDPQSTVGKVQGEEESEPGKRSSVVSHHDKPSRRMFSNRRISFAMFGDKDKNILSGTDGGDRSPETINEQHSDPQLSTRRTRSNSSEVSTQPSSANEDVDHDGDVDGGDNTRRSEEITSSRVPVTRSTHKQMGGAKRSVDRSTAKSRSYLSSRRSIGNSIRHSISPSPSQPLHSDKVAGSGSVGSEFYFKEDKCSLDMPWIDAVIQFMNYTNFSCKHQSPQCPISCFERQQRQSRGLLNAIRHVYACQTSQSFARSLDTQARAEQVLRDCASQQQKDSATGEDSDGHSDSTTSDDDNVFESDQALGPRRRRRRSHLSSVDSSTRRRSEDAEEQVDNGEDRNPSSSSKQKRSCMKRQARFDRESIPSLSTSSSPLIKWQDDIASTEASIIEENGHDDDEYSMDRRGSRQSSTVTASLDLDQTIQKRRKGGKRKGSCQLGGGEGGVRDQPSFFSRIKPGKSSTSPNLLTPRESNDSGQQGVTGLLSLGMLAGAGAGLLKSVGATGASEGGDQSLLSLMTSSSIDGFNTVDPSKSSNTNAPMKVIDMPIQRYLESEVKELTSNSLNLLNKGALLLTVDQLVKVLQFAWELLLDTDEEVTSSAACFFIFCGVKAPRQVQTILLKELQHENPSQRFDAVLRFRALWTHRHHVWSRLDENASNQLRIPSPFIEFVLPSPTIGLPGVDAPDPSWQIRVGTSAEEVQLKQNEATKTFVTASTSRRKQQQELLARALAADAIRRRFDRQQYHLTTFPILDRATIEPAFGKEHRDECVVDEGLLGVVPGGSTGFATTGLGPVQEEFNAAVRRVSIAPINRTAQLQTRTSSWRQNSLPWLRTSSAIPQEDEDRGACLSNLLPSQPLQQAQQAFPSALCAATLPLIYLLDDLAVNSSGSSVNTIAELVIFQCLVDDPGLFLRFLFERLTRVANKDGLIHALRKLITRLPELPMQASHILFNNLVGFIMFHVRTPSANGPEVIAGALSVAHLVVPHVQNIYFKDLKQVMRREQIDSTLLLTANLPSARQFNVFDDEVGVAQLVRLQDENKDYRFLDILVDVLDNNDVSQDQRYRYFLCDNKSNIIRNAAHYIRDFYPFKRNHTPKLRLRQYQFDEALRLLQRNALNLKFQEIGKVLFTTSVLKYSKQSQISNHVFFLQDELTKLPSFPRKALESDFTLFPFTQSNRQPLFSLDKLHKLGWCQLISTLFANMSPTYPWTTDLHLFLNVYNGTLILCPEDASILRHCLASYIQCCYQFKTIFSTSGYAGILPTLLRVYNQHLHNPVLTQAIEFTCRQFYIMHRTPFILQLFGCVANYLTPVNGMASSLSDSSSTFYTIQPVTLYRLVRLLSRPLTDNLHILELCRINKPLKALDFCYNDDDDASWSIVDAVTLCVAVIAYAPDSYRARQMLVILQAIMPFILCDLPSICAEENLFNDPKKNEMTTIQKLSVAMRQLIAITESITKRGDDSRQTNIVAPGGPAERLAELPTTLLPRTAPTSWNRSLFKTGSSSAALHGHRNRHNPTVGQRRDASLLLRARRGRLFSATVASTTSTVHDEIGGGGSSFDLTDSRHPPKSTSVSSSGLRSVNLIDPKEVVLQLTCSFLLTCHTRLAEIGERQRITELLDAKSHIRLSELAQSIVKHGASSLLRLTSSLSPPSLQPLPMLLTSSTAVGTDSREVLAGKRQRRRVTLFTPALLTYIDDILPAIDWVSESVKSCKALESLLSRLNRTLPRLFDSNRTDIAWDDGIQLVHSIFSIVKKNRSIAHLKEIRIMTELLKKIILFDLTGLSSGSTPGKGLLSPTTITSSPGDATVSGGEGQNPGREKSRRHRIHSHHHHHHHSLHHRGHQCQQHRDSSQALETKGDDGDGKAGPLPDAGCHGDKSRASSSTSNVGRYGNHGDSDQRQVIADNEVVNDGPSQFSAEVIRLLALVLQIQGNSCTLKDLCERSSTDYSIKCPGIFDGGFATMTIYLSRLIIPLLFRSCAGRKDSPTLSRDNIFYALDVCITALFAVDDDRQSVSNTATTTTTITNPFNSSYSSNKKKVFGESTQAGDRVIQRTSPITASVRSSSGLLAIRSNPLALLTGGGGGCSQDHHHEPSLIGQPKQLGGPSTIKLTLVNGPPGSTGVGQPGNLIRLLVPIIPVSSEATMAATATTVIDTISPAGKSKPKATRIGSLSVTADVSAITQGGKRRQKSPQREVASRRGGGSLGPNSLPHHHQHQYKVDFTNRLGFLGLKLLLTAYSRHASIKLSLITAALTRLALSEDKCSHENVSSSSSMWKFFDFMVTRRPPIFIHLLPFIRYKMANLTCATPGEQAYQQIVNQKLIGLHLPIQQTISSTLRDLMTELCHIQADIEYFGKLCTAESKSPPSRASFMHSSLRRLYSVSSSTAPSTVVETHSRVSMDSSSLDHHRESSERQVHTKSKHEKHSKGSRGRVSLVRKESPSLVDGSTPGGRVSVKLSHESRSLVVKSNTTSRIRPHDGSRSLMSSGIGSQTDPILTASTESLARPSQSRSSSKSKNRLKAKKSTQLYHHRHHYQKTAVGSSIIHRDGDDSLVTFTPLSPSGSSEDGESEFNISAGPSEAAAMASSLYGSEAPYLRARQRDCQKARLAEEGGGSKRGSTLTPLIESTTGVDGTTDQDRPDQVVTADFPDSLANQPMSSAELSTRDSSSSPMADGSSASPHQVATKKNQKSSKINYV